MTTFDHPMASPYTNTDRAREAYPELPLQIQSVLNDMSDQNSSAAEVRLHALLALIIARLDDHGLAVEEAAYTAQATSETVGPLVDRVESLAQNRLLEAATALAEFFRNGTPVHPGSHVAQDLIAAVDALKR